MPETIPISPDLISTRASEASEESIRAGAGVRNARLREGRLRRSEAAIPSETYNGEAEAGGERRRRSSRRRPASLRDGERGLGSRKMIWFLGLLLAHNI
jgi:hypothetical protein